MVLRVVEALRDKRGKVEEYICETVAGGKIRYSREDFINAISSNKVTGYSITKHGHVINSAKKDMYYIMNKDREVALFNMCGMTLIELYGTLPYGFDTVDKWIGDRLNFECAYCKEYFYDTVGWIDKSTGELSKTTAVKYTHCVSLSDTFWIKAVDSSLDWDSVSPYKCKYSDVAGIYGIEHLFVGNFSDGEERLYSPIYSSRGGYPHTYVRKGNKIKFFKAGSKYTIGGYYSGFEPFSEYFASQLLDYLGFNHVKYSLASYTRQDNNIDIVTVCDMYTSEKYGAVSAYDLGISSYKELFDTCEGIGKDCLKQLCDMVFTDYILSNTDRHMNNIEFVIDNDTLNIIGLHPIFDNNESMYPRFGGSLADLKKKKPGDTSTPLGWTLERSYLYLLKYAEYKKELLKLKKFKFSTEGIQSKRCLQMISDERLQFMNDLLQHNVESALCMEETTGYFGLRG